MCFCSSGFIVSAVITLSLISVSRSFQTVVNSSDGSLHFAHAYLLRDEGGFYWGPCSKGYADGSILSPNLYQPSTEDKHLSYGSLYTLSYETDSVIADDPSKTLYATYFDEWLWNCARVEHRKLDIPLVTAELAGLAQRLEVDIGEWDLTTYLLSPTNHDATEFVLYSLLADHPERGLTELTRLKREPSESLPTGGSAYDYFDYRYKGNRGLLYIQLGTMIHLIDVRDNYKILWSLKTPFLLDTISYDQKTTNVYGTGFDDHLQKRYLVTMDRFGNFSSMALPKPYLHETRALPLGTIDFQKRIYTIAIGATATGSEDKDLYYDMIALSLDKEFGMIKNTARCSAKGSTELKAEDKLCPKFVQYQIPNS